MYAQGDASSIHAKKLRKYGGHYLKKLRESVGMTQKGIADQLGFSYYTFVSQLESGVGRVPPHLYEQYADVLHVDRHDFAKHMLMYYSPFIYKALYGIPLENDLKGLTTSRNLDQARGAG